MPAKKNIATYSRLMWGWKSFRQTRGSPRHLQVGTLCCSARPASGIAEARFMKFSLPGAPRELTRATPCAKLLYSLSLLPAYEEEAQA